MSGSNVIAQPKARKKKKNNIINQHDMRLNILLYCQLITWKLA